ncbi:flagellar filament capping protein FliD [Chromobacterium vaccinii]|uniref:flagellar filament capping protein FliD n=1 Tax=Chromobacterium vaccinii TaxID=1108595 RepID=UPI001E2EBA54|nr:flagellar filament capping protein FliD [Chromobacterium vaccinii]MCD4483890.1 flagellar filament capping protein FliD [Chromobacterium vaccinii]
MNSLSGYNSSFSSFDSLLPNLSSLLSSGLLLGSSSAASQSSASSSATDPIQIELSTLGQLMSILGTFQSSLQQIYAPSIQFGGGTASSSNPAVASVSTSTGAQNASYLLNVSQLAQAHSATTSFSLSDSGTTVVGSGSLTITTGSYAYTSSTSATSFTANDTPVTISISNGTLSSIASSINGANAGVVANVVQNSSGAYQLQISQASTGASNNFKISVSDNDGNNTDQSGLSRLAFDQTLAVGSGQNLTQTQAALNASYTVNGASGSNASNFGIQLGSGVSANLLATGSSNITVNVDFGQLNTNAQSLASAFNTAQGSINSLLGNQVLPSNDPIAAMLPRMLNQQVQNSYSNGSSLLTMLSQVGLSYQRPAQYGLGGTLSLNVNSLQAAYNSDSSGAANLLYTAAQSLNALANSYTSQGSGSLVNETRALQTQQRNRQLVIHTPQTPNTFPFNLQNLLSYPSGNSMLSAQQISGLAMYALVYSIGAPYTLNALLVGQGLGLSSSGFSATA